MEIIKEKITGPLRKLSEVNAHFLEFVKKNPGTLKRSNFGNLFEHNLDLGDIQPWPTFINQQGKKQLQEASTTVFNLVKQIPQRLFSNNIQKISAYYGFAKEYTQIQLKGLQGGHLENLLARGDFVFSPSGLKCIEYNVSAGIGGWQVALLEPMYLSTPIIAKFLQEYNIKIYNKNLFLILLQHLLTPVMDKFPDLNNGEVNIALVIPKYEKIGNTSIKAKYFNHAYQRVLNAKCNHLRGEAVFCDFHHLKVVKDCVFYREKRIHMLLEWYHGDVPLEILYVSLLGNVMLYNGPITKLLSNKLNHALLSENEDSQVFSLEEREAIKKYIPWTRRIVPGEVTFGREQFNLEDFILTNRVKLIVKPVGEFGGKQVYIGKFTPGKQWRKMVNQVFLDNDRDWIVQEYVESFPILYQRGVNGYAEHDVIWGLFVFGSTYAGGFLRVMPKQSNTGVINTYQGAEKTVILEVDE